MGNIKVKHDDEWKVVSSNTANGISANSPLIQKDENTSVEDVLVDHEGRVDKLEKNVAWLAKYGIGKGGSGGGSGTSDDYIATCSIKVNGYSQSDIPSTGVGFDDKTGVIIRLDNISKNSLLNSWSVVVMSGNKQLRKISLSSSNPYFSIPYSELSGSLSNHIMPLYITASYEDYVKGIIGAETWSGNIYESIVNISATDVSFDITDTSTNKNIVYTVSVGIPGDYRLSISAWKDDVACSIYEPHVFTIPNTESNTINVPLSDIISNIEGGSYLLEGHLENDSVSTLASSCRSTVNCVSNVIIISTSVLSRDSNNPVSVSTAGLLNLVWTAFVSNTATFTYNYTLHYSDQTEEIFASPKIGYFGRPVSESISAIGKEWAVDNQAIALDINLTSSSGVTKTETFYFIMEQSSSDFLPMSASSTSSCISEFLAYNCPSGSQSLTMETTNYYYSLRNHTIESSISLENSSTLCGSKGGTGNIAPYFRISNGAYAKLSLVSSTPNINNLGFHSLLSRNFTISICFKADYHPDDTRTVLFWGTCDQNTGAPSNGIEIGVHDVFINGASVIPLIDNTLNNIDITCERFSHEVIIEGESRQIEESLIKVFVNGNLSAAVTKQNFDVSSFPEFIYLGGKIYNNSLHEEWCCDCNIYSLRVYSSVLSDFDIVLRNMNDEVLTKMENGAYDFSILQELLVRNMCYVDTSSNSPVVKSYIYDVGSNQYTVPNNIIKNGVIDAQSIDDNVRKAFGIPVMLIDVQSNQNWTFNAFVTRQQEDMSRMDMPSATGVTISYWDPKGTNQDVLTLENCAVSLQGTSTLADAVKNLNITVGDDVVFIPKSTWLPEQTYTLKADVVDSSHSFNAAMGSFINEALGGGGEGSWLTFPSDIVNAFNSSAYVQYIQKTATLKHTVEGFPIFLIMRFAVTPTSTISTTPLGIYSFNLGRNAYRNLGFKIITSISSITEEITSFPFVASGCDFTETLMNARWVEPSATETVQDLQDLVSGDASSFAPSNGHFWQDDGTVAAHLYDIRYDGRFSEYAGQHFDSTMNRGNDDFLGLVYDIMRLPIERPCSTGGSTGNIDRSDLNIEYSTYTYNSNSGSYSEKEETINTGNTSQNDIDINTFNLDLSSAYKYLAVCCFGGLVDNLGKNLALKKWGNSKYYTGFYDMDCGAGGDNQGGLTVATNLWLRGITNSNAGSYNEHPYGYACETYDKVSDFPSSVFSGSTNKLWLSIDTQFMQRKLEVGTSQYGEQWRGLRKFLDDKVAAENETLTDDKYSDCVDYFMKKYFLAQTRDCGSLLFNLDYRLKYFFQFDLTSNQYNNVNFINKLHGRKEAYTRNWLTKHTLFMDSLYAWRESSVSGVTMTYRNDYNTALNGAVYGAPALLPVKYNTNLIIRHNVGSGKNSFFYAPENTEVWLDAGPEVPSGGVRTWSITNIPQLMQIGNEEVPMSSMYVNRIQSQSTQDYWSSPGLLRMTSLLLSGNEWFDGSTLNFLDPFKPSEGVSELRSVDLSNTKVYGSGNSFSLDFTFISDGRTYTQFTKLRDLNISGSTAISSVTIPPVPLRTLLVSNSSITQFSLENQSFIQNVDLTGCNRIVSVTIKECQSYETLELSNLHNLTTVTVTNNPSLNSVSIRNCPSLTTVNIETNNLLQNITVSNCDSVQSITVNSCPAIKRLDFSNNSSLESLSISSIGWGNVTYLDLSYSPISTIVSDDSDVVDEDTDNGSLLDLNKFTGLQTIDMEHNTGVRRIQFANNLSNPIIVSSFVECRNLERIYGHVKINGTNSSSADTSAPFYGCSKFTIHGDNPNNNGLGVSSFDDKTVWELTTKYRVKTIWELYNVGATWSDVFQEGSLKTNLGFTSNSTLNYTFAGTSLTQFDVYYACFAIACAKGNSNFTMSRTFYNLKRGNNAYRLFAYNRNTVENYPSRYLFYGFSRCTSMTEVFSGGGSSTDVIYILSPEVDSNGTVIQDNGVFSPLTGLKTYNRVFYGKQISFSKYVFARSTGAYALESLSEQGMVNLYPNDNWILDSTASNPDITSYGNFEGFFDYLTSLKTIDRVFGLNYIDFGTIHLPATVEYVYASFVGGTGTRGDINFNNIFTPNGSSRRVVKCITGSFRSPSDANISYGTQATFELSENTFSGLPDLIHFGYHPNITSYGTISNGSCKNANKTVQGNTLPTNLFDNNPQLVTAGNVYEGFNHISVSGEFPGELFKKTTNLQNIGAFFKNSNVHLTLTSGGFINCPNLRDVQQLFCEEQKEGDTLRQCLGSATIPYKFLYHGEDNVTITYQGKNGETMPDSTDNMLEGTINVASVKSTIIDAHQMFKGCYTLDNYSVTNVETIVENNPDYRQYRWIYNPQTESWVENTEDKEQQAYWGFDGDFQNNHYTEYSSDFFSTIKLLESEVTTDGVIYNNTHHNGATLNYICPPDLLRYCSSTCNVTGLFEYCGKDIIGLNSSLIESNDNTYKYGIHGRICPYMLKPVGNTTDISRMFKFCRQLSGYKSGSTIYLIPPTFFSYAPKIKTLTEAFEGMIFPYNVTLSVFGSLNSSLDVRKLFACSLYNNNGNNTPIKTTVSGVLSGKNISYLTGIFACNDLNLDSSNLHKASTREYWDFTVPSSTAVISNNFYGSRLPNSENIRFVYYRWGYNENYHDADIPNSENNY